MLLHQDHSRLLLIDMQDKLLSQVHDSAEVLEACVWLARLANRLGVPAMMSEQYPKGLGPSALALREHVAPSMVAEKVHFSCVAARCFDALPDTGRRQVVVAGIEAHVCVLQTAIDLKLAGDEVFVVADAVSSRHPRDTGLALQRMRDAGIQVLSREMVLFEWARQAGTQQFKELSQQFLR